MMNEPTNRAITANTIRKTLKKLMSSFIASCCSLVISAPVSTSRARGAPWRPALDEFVLADAVAATTRIASILPGSVRYRCAAAGVNIVNDAPPGLSVPPNVAMPTIVTGCGPDWVRTVVESPSAKSPFSALALSITTSLSVDRRSPCVESRTGSGRRR